MGREWVNTVENGSKRFDFLTQDLCILVLYYQVTQHAFTLSRKHLCLFFLFGFHLQSTTLGQGCPMNFLTELLIYPGRSHITLLRFAKAS